MPIGAELRARYLRGEFAELVNRIITGYYPVVAGQSGFSGLRKKVKMDNFLVQLTQNIY